MERSETMDEQIQGYYIHSCWGTPIIRVYTEKQSVTLGARRTRELLNRVLDKEIIGKNLEIVTERGKKYGEVKG